MCRTAKHQVTKSLLPFVLIHIPRAPLLTCWHVDQAVCLPDSTIVLCFVPAAPLQRNSHSLANISPTFRVYFKGEELSNSPMQVALTATNQAVAGCTRPSVSRLTSMCALDAPLLHMPEATASVDDMPLPPPRHARHHSCLREGEIIEGVQGSKEQGGDDKVYSSGSKFVRVCVCVRARALNFLYIILLCVCVCVCVCFIYLCLRACMMKVRAQVRGLPRISF